MSTVWGQPRLLEVKIQAFQRQFPVRLQFPLGVKHLLPSSPGTEHNAALDVLSRDARMTMSSFEGLQFLYPFHPGTPLLNNPFETDLLQTLDKVLVKFLPAIVDSLSVDPSSQASTIFHMDPTSID